MKLLQLCFEYKRWFSFKVLSKIQSHSFWAADHNALWQDLTLSKCTFLVLQRWVRGEIHGLAAHNAALHTWSRVGDLGDPALPGRALFTFFPSHVPCQGGRGVQSQCIILNREARLAPPASVHCAMCNVHCALCTVQCARMEGLKARRSDNPSIIDSAVKAGTVVVAAEFLLVGLEIFLIGHSLGDGGLLHGWWTVSPQQRMCLHIEQGYQTQR